MASLIKNFLGLFNQEEVESDMEYSVSESPSPRSVSSEISDVSDVSDIVSDVSDSEVMDIEHEEKMSEIKNGKLLIRHNKNLKPKKPETPKGSNIRFDFTKPIPVIAQVGRWDFMTLYKALIYANYNDESNPEYKKFLNHLKVNNLEFRKNKQYIKEKIKLEQMFQNRYNNLKDVQLKLQSLQFIKNGLYIQETEKLEKWKKIVSDQKYALHIKDLTEQASSGLVALSRTDKSKLKKHNKMLKNIQQYENVVIGGLVETLRFEKKVNKKRRTTLQIISELNKEFEKSNTIDTTLEKIAAQNKKEFILENEQKPKEKNIYLKSKMVYHIRRFFDITEREAAMLLKNNMFDKVIKYNREEMEKKLIDVTNELTSYEPIVNFLKAMQEKTFLSPHCGTHMNNSFMLSMFISTVHKSGEAPLYVIKPFEIDGVFYNPYDSYSSKNIKDVFYHMKIHNKIRFDKEWVKSNVKTIKEPMSMTKNQFDSTVRTMTVSDNGVLTNKIKKAVEKKEDEDDFDMEDLFGSDEEEEEIREEINQRLDDGERFKQMILAKNAVFYEMLTESEKKQVNKVLDVAKKTKTFRTYVHRWVDSFFVKFFSQKMYKKIGLDDIIVKINGTVELRYTNLHELPQLVKDVNINGEDYIKNYVLKNTEQEIEMSREEMIELIKNEIIKEKVKEFSKTFARSLLANSKNLQDGNILIKEIQNDLPEFFENVMFNKNSNRDIDSTLDRIVLKLKNIKTKEDLDENMFNEIFYETLKGTYGRGDIKLEEYANVDHVLFYILLSYLPKTNDVVIKIFELLNGNVELEEKNYVWEWLNMHTKKEQKNHKKDHLKVSGEEIVDKLKPFDERIDNSEYDITREFFAKRKTFFNKVDFSKYNTDEMKTLNMYKKYLLNARIRKIIQENEYMRLKGIVLFIKLKNAIEPVLNKKTNNADILNRMFKILKIDLEEKPRFVKQRAIRNQMPVKPQEVRENKDDLLNNFMELDENVLELKAEIEEQVGGPVDVNNDAENMKNDIAAQNYMDMLNDDYEVDQDNYNVEQHDVAEDIEEMFNVEEDQ